MALFIHKVPMYPKLTIYLLLTYEQLNQDEESVASYCNFSRKLILIPTFIISGRNRRALGSRQLHLINLRVFGIFGRKKTGNYLANKFFEDNEYFNAYRIYTALRDVDPFPVLAVPNPLSNRSLRRKAWKLCTGYGNLLID